MPTVAEQLTELVAAAANAAGLGDAAAPMEPAVPTADARFGDYQSNFGFRLGKALRQNPREVAGKLVAHLPPSPLVAEASVAGPGFVNLTLSDAGIATAVSAAAIDARFGATPVGPGSTLVIDYSSPNIAKRMHVGHMRSTIIGHALHRIHAFLGWNVIADNHIGDWGTQFGKLIVAWDEGRDEAAFAEDAIGELQRLYRWFGEVAAERPEWLDRAREETARLQAGDPRARALWQRFVDVSLAEFEAVYERLGVRFDVVLGESFYNDALGPLVDDLLARGIAEVSDGAVIIPFTEEDGKGLSSSPLLIRKRDGAALYGTTDLATVAYRKATWSPDRVLYVTDVRQQLHFRQVFAAARKAGMALNFEHIWFGMLRLPDGAIAATRGGGQLVNLVDVLDEAVRRARAVVDEKSGELPDAERAAIAEAVGLGAVRYADLSQNPQSDITFDWDKMLALNGNTAPYLQYAHARLCSLLRRAGYADPEDAPVALSTVAHPAERALALAALRVPEIAVAAASSARPNLVCDHLFTLAGHVATFWNECPVLAEDVADDARARRLALVAATARALRLGLGMLGIEAPARM